ncbi:hypothetical protein AB0L05_40630 [Nonomuraea pusilla]|uniref:hypothetical protein n=1 Tax=Nonomuraea pusilla TaxID=46177 RepID=UPI00331E9F31
MLVLGVQRVGDDHGAGQIEAGQQGQERGDLVALCRDLPLGGDGLGVVAQGGQQADSTVGGRSAAEQHPAVHRQTDERGPARRPVVIAFEWGAGGKGGETVAGRGVESVAVQARQQASKGTGGQADGARESGTGQEAGAVSADAMARERGPCS